MENDIRKTMFVKLYYSLLDWAWINDPNTLVVFIHLLLNANRKDQPYHKGIIRKGEVLASYEFLANKTGLSVQQVRRAVENLIYTGDISRKIIGKTCVYTLNCWSKMENCFVDYNFSDYEKDEEQQGFNDSETAEYSHSEIQDNKAQQRKNNETSTKEQKRSNEKTRNEQLSNNEITAHIYCKNEENAILRECESERAHTRGKLRNVIISPDEYESFRKEYPRTADKIIDELSEKIATDERKYQSGHIGHLYVFARNYKELKKEERISEPAYNIELALQKARKLDPTKTKKTICNSNKKNE